VPKDLEQSGRAGACYCSHIGYVPRRYEIYAHPKGKQTVYHAKQAPREQETQADVVTQEGLLRSLKDEASALKTEEKSLKERLATLETASKVEEFEAEVLKQSSLNQRIEEEIRALEEGQTVQYSPEEAGNITRQWKELTHKATETKRMVLDLWALVVENLPDGKAATELQVGNTPEESTGLQDLGRARTRL
jgi:hypothetical protein